MAKKKPPVIIITASQLRDNLPEILMRVKILEQEYVLTKHGKPVAELKPMPPDSP